LGRIRPSLPVQLNHIRRSVVATLRAINAAQQSRSDVPVLAAFSDNCNSLFVVAREHTNLKRPTFRLKRNPIANTELQHLGVSPHVSQEFQPLDNPIVEINQFSFGKTVNVDPHNHSNSHDSKRRLTRVVLGTHAETFQNGDGIPRARQMLRTVPCGFPMTRHGGGFPGLAVDEEAMLSSFAHELAALTLKMPN
jgi:hypothetical protein